MHLNLLLQRQLRYLATFLLLSFSLSGINAQFFPADDENPGYGIKQDSTGNMLKAVTGMTWNALSNGSDYYIYYTWSGATVGCSCDKRIDFDFKNNGNAAGSWNNVSTSHSGTSYKYGMGPSQMGKFTFKAPYSGHNYFIVCEVNCSGSWSSTGSLTRYTSSIKAPTDVQASDDESDSYIRVTWKSQTHIPNSLHGYKIYRDGILVHSQYNSTGRSWIDNDVSPDQKYYYTVQTYTNSWGGHSSWAPGDYGETFFMAPTATPGKTNVNIAWTSPKDIGADQVKVERTDGNTTISLDVVDVNQTNYLDNTGIPGFSYTYILTPLADGKTFFPAEIQGYILSNGRISGEVKTVSGTGVPDVIVSAVRQGTIPQGETNTYTDTTDATGYYEIKEIYYHTEASFKISPSKEEHGFDPAEATRTLDETSFVYNVNFIDTSSFVLSGNINQIFNDDTCQVEDVEILVNDLYKGIKTDADGFFTLTVDRMGEYTVTPRLDSNSFSPASQTFNVTQDVHEINFEDTTRYVLSGYVRGSCDIYIGTADLRIFSKGDPTGCFDISITTDEGTGYYEVELPAREYYITLEKFYPSNPDVANAIDVEDYFLTEEADLTIGDAQKNLIYRKAPTIEISGFSDLGCGAYDGIPIVQQGQILPLIIDVVETFGQETCLTDTGYVVVINGLVNGATKIDTIMLENGSTQYNLIAGDPNIIAPHTKLFEVTANVEGQIDQYTTDALIVGNRPREKTFISVSPEIPFTILRDPPGDASYSFMNQGTTNVTTMSFLTQASGSVKAWAEVKAGVKFEAGLGVTTETSVWGSIRGSMEVGASLLNQEEFSLAITNTQDFSTSGNQNVTGQEGDVFVGASMNLIYALTDILEYDPDGCGVNLSVDIIMGSDGFNTTFMYTDNHIRHVLIPQLEQLRDLYLQDQSDSAKIYANQIKVWQQTLNLNEEQKKNSRFIENRSFSAGAQYQATEEVSKTRIGSVEFNMFIEESVALEAGLEIGGSGFSGGVDASFRLDIGGSKSQATTTTTRTGYVLNDDDVGDFFSIDILADEVYGTPVFNLVSGRSKCPWELGTQPREGVQLLSDAFTRFVDDPAGEAVFRLSLGNTSQSEEDFIYNLAFLQESNPDGAAITLGGSPVQGGIFTPYSVPAGGSREATVTVKRGPLSFDYPNLQFAIFSSCADAGIADTVGLTVHFESNCSEITLRRPFNNWQVSALDSGLLFIRMEDYDTEALNFLTLQYTPAGTNSWQSDVIFEKANLGDPYTEYEWAVPEISDGHYDLRVKVECEGGYSYSDILTGRIDRNYPELFGIPEPIDGYMDEGDLLSVRFNEPINCDAINAANIKLTSLTSQKQYPVSVGCNNDKLILIPDLGTDNVAADTFSVEIYGVMDKFGNMRPDTVDWTFIVRGEDSFVIDADADTDGDGIPNAEDNCPYAANADQEDLDGDGKGDACDEDIDGDGIPNITDNCKYMSNPDQADADTNNIGDVCEPIADGDGDGIINAEDNCPFVANPGQEDMDNDGIGDACDDDMDGDGVINTKDNCASTANPDQADSNNDGTGNACQTVSIDALTADSYSLLQNYPNPFSDFTTIKFVTPEDAQVLLRVYSVIGEEVMVANRQVERGLHEHVWNTENNKSGIYFYTVTIRSNAGEIVFSDTKRMILQK